jgi:hypothetical protein
MLKSKPRRGAFDYLLDPQFRAPEPPVPPRREDGPRRVHIVIELLPYQVSRPPSRGLSWRILGAAAAILALASLCGCNSDGSVCWNHCDWASQPEVARDVAGNPVPPEPPTPEVTVTPEQMQQVNRWRAQHNVQDWSITNGNGRPMGSCQTWDDGGSRVVSCNQYQTPLEQNSGFFEKMWESQ